MNLSTMDAPAEPGEPWPEDLNELCQRLERHSDQPATRERIRAAVAAGLVAVLPHPDDPNRVRIVPLPSRLDRPGR